MRLHRRLVYLALLFAVPARAELIKLALYDFRAQGAAAPLATVLQGRTADALQRQGFFKVVTSDALRSLLALERQKQLLGCSEGESTCMAEVADALGVQYLVTGTVTALGKKGAETF